MEGRYLSCLDVKEPKKIIPVPRFRQITPKNKVRKSKKIGNGPFFMFKYPCLGFFSVGVRVPYDNGGLLFVMFGNLGGKAERLEVLFSLKENRVSRCYSGEYCSSDRD